MKVIIALMIGLGLAQQAFGAVGESRTEIIGNKKVGTYLGLGNPYPSLIGINGAYNIDKNMRAVVGYGEVEVTTSVGFGANGFTESKVKAQTYTAGMDYLFLESSFRPVAGLRLGYFNVSGDGTFSVQGIDKSTMLIYSNVGLDWVADSGLNLGTGFNVAMLGGRGANFYANVGYFF